MQRNRARRNLGPSSGGDYMDIRYITVFGFRIWIDSFIMIIAWIVLIVASTALVWYCEAKTKRGE
jgi:hypothetical protein